MEAIPSRRFRLVSQLLDQQIGPHQLEDAQYAGPRGIQADVVYFELAATGHAPREQKEGSG